MWDAANEQVKTILPHPRYSPSPSLHPLTLATLPYQVKLADFGVSSIAEGGQHKDYVRATAGTPAFYAPEMCGDDKTGARVYSGRAADLWALGVCLPAAACRRRLAPSAVGRM